MKEDIRCSLSTSALSHFVLNADWIQLHRQKRKMMLDIIFRVLENIWIKNLCSITWEEFCIIRTGLWFEYYNPIILKHQKKCETSLLNSSSTLLKICNNYKMHSLLNKFGQRVQELNQEVSAFYHIFGLRMFRPFL